MKIVGLNGWNNYGTSFIMKNGKIKVKNVSVITQVKTVFNICDHGNCLMDAAFPSFFSTEILFHHHWTVLLLQIEPLHFFKQPILKCDL